MVDRRKVLTVSYGRFYCTLEGFDDPAAALRDVLAHLRAAAEEMPGFAGVADPDAALRGADTGAPAPGGHDAAPGDDPAAAEAARIVRFERRHASPAADHAAAQPAGPDLAEFAARLGAVALSEQAEAAALHAALVAGRASVARAEMLHTLRRLAPDADRDAVMRAFVGLRRDGRLAQVGPGRFRVTERCPLMAAARHIAS